MGFVLKKGVKFQSILKYMDDKIVNFKTEHDLEIFIKKLIKFDGLNLLINKKEITIII
jgi:hypothetical protein